MRNFRFWLPTILGTLLTPPLIFLAAMSTGAGHGSYAAATVIYPPSMVIMVMLAGVTVGGPLEVFSLGLVVGLAILQLPLYGFVLSYAHLKGGWWLIAAAMIYLHLVVIVVWSVIAGLIWGIVGS